MGARHGRGGFGSGPFGRWYHQYAWKSDALESGTYKFAVRPVDAAGNEYASLLTDTVVISTYPKPPTGLGYTYDSGTKKATLTWTLSESDLTL